MRLPILVIHICGGIIGLLSGGAAIWVPQRLLPTSPSRKRIFRRDACHGFKRPVSGQCFQRAIRVLSGDHRVVDRQAARGGNEHFRLVCTSVWRCGRSCYRDPWRKSGEWLVAGAAWSSCWNDLFCWFRSPACCRRRRSHARARRCFR